MSDAAEPDDEQQDEEPGAYETLDDQQRDIYSRLASPLWSIYQSFAPVVPFRQRIFKRLAVKSLENYYKVTGGDAIGLIAEPGQKLSLIPVKYKPPEACEEGEKAGWHAKGQDKSWEAGSEGHVVDFLGRTPIVALERDSHVEAGWLKPRIAEAIELERYDPLFANATINAVFDVGDQAAGGQQQAVADGGQNQQARWKGFEVDDPGMFAGDAVVDLQSEDEHDGMRVSFRKASEWMSETTTTQEMQMQEDRGYLRGKMAAGSGPSIFKLLLVCAAIILGTLLIIFVVPEFIGGSGGGSTMPSLQLAPLLSMMGVL